MSEESRKIRLQKFIGETGLLSRRKAEEAISQGRVSVNGRVVTELGTKVDPEQDAILLDGKAITRTSKKTVIVFHKPRRVVTTKSDPEGRKTVMDYLPAEYRHLKPVGRLDFDSEGLILFTDDGELANRIMHPRYGMKKTYLAWVSGIPEKSSLELLLHGVSLTDGPGRFLSVRVLKKEAVPPGAQLEAVVGEGRNRFVRRMFEAVGHPVLRLRRTRIGDLDLGTLQSGRWRLLSQSESELFSRSCGRTPDVSGR